MQFKGSITALITPFQKGGEIDWKAFDNFVEWQIAQGTHGVVPCGTTGECPTVSHDEHMAIVQRCIDVVNKRIPVIAGTGSNSTREAIGLTQHAAKAGADAALIVTPYYNKPSPEGLYQHYKTIHDAVDIPIILYNVPGRCVIDMKNDLVARLSELPRIVGIKDATGDLSRVKEMTAFKGGKFVLLSGDDETAGGFLEQGGHGMISVTSNVAPALCAEFQNAWMKKDIAAFKAAREKLRLLDKNLFVEANPMPVKYAASLLGLCKDEFRLPLVPIRAENRKAVEEAMDHAGLRAGKPAAKTAARG